MIYLKEGFKSSLSKQLNLHLYSAIINFVKQSAKADKLNIYNPRLNLLMINDSVLNLKDEYKLLYFGEILERHKERNLNTKQDLRAIAIALALSEEYQDSSMFVTQQKDNFIKNLKKELEKEYDVYLAVSLYYLIENEKEKELLIDNILNTKYNDTTDIFFLFVLPKEKIINILLQCKEQIIQFLGKTKTISIEGDEAYFVYFINCIREYTDILNKKDYKLLKCLVKLSEKKITEKDSAYKLLKEYFEEWEIYYINYIFTVYSENKPSFGVLTNEIIAVNFCVSILSREKPLRETSKKLIMNLLEKYKNFSVKCMNYYNIHFLLIKKVQFHNNTTYLWLYNIYKNKEYSTTGDCFLVSPIENDKQDIFRSLSEEEGMNIITEMILQFENSTCDKEKAEKYLEAFQSITGLDKEHYFDNYSNFRLFSKLVDLKIIDLNSYINNLPKISKNIKSSIERYIYFVPNKTAFDFITQVYEKIGAESFEFLNFDFGSFLRREDRYWNSQKYLSINMPYLNHKETKVLLNLIDDWFFYKRPTEYKMFVTAFLVNDKLRNLFSKEEIRDIYLLIKSYISDDRLDNILLTEKELQEKKEREKEKNEEEKRKQLEKVKSETKERFYKVYNNTIHSLYDIIYNWHHYGCLSNMKINCFFVNQELNNLIRNESCQKLFKAKEDVTDFLYIIMKLYKYEYLTLMECKELFLKIEYIEKEKR